MSMLQASLLAWLLSLGGMVALAFAMDRHYTQWTGRDDIPPALRVLLRGVGVLLLAGVWVPCVWGWSATVGTVATIGFWSLGALLAAGGMSWSPRWTARAGAVAALLGGSGCVLPLLLAMRW
ncbi:MAG: DUF3325 domain-containing protein [Comamonas sp.]|nr:DUF3325 domain-containing protein [Comamonas sp.]